MACVFCSRNFIEGQLIAETASFMVIAALGQLPEDGGHVLIISRAHLSSMRQCDDRQAQELDALICDIEEVILKEYDVRPLIFENGGVGQSVKHAHVHVVPVSIPEKRLTTRVRMTPHASYIIYANFDIFRRFARIHRNGKDSYVLWKLPSDRGIHVLTQPLLHGFTFRSAIAELIGARERGGDWQSMPRDADEGRWRDTAQRLRPYF